MKNIKMLVSMAGPDEHYIPGDELTVSDEVAKAWQEAGIAEIVEDKPKRDKAAVSDGN